MQCAEDNQGLVILFGLLLLDIIIFFLIFLFFICIFQSNIAAYH